MVRANLAAIGISPARFGDRASGILLSDATELLVATSPKADGPSSSAAFGSRTGSGKSLDVRVVRKAAAMVSELCQQGWS